MKKNIAVVGCGHWGKNLIRNFYELGVLHSICDLDTEAANFIANKYNVENLSLKTVINNDDIQGVVLAVPAPMHAKFGMQVIKAGKDVFIEKPLATNTADAIKLIDESKKQNVQLMVGHLLQYHPVFKKLSKMIESKTIGDINYIYSNRLSFGKVRSQEDVIWSFAPHDISMILAIAKDLPLSLRTQSSCILQKEIADTAIINMDFQSGLRAHISVSWINPYKEQKLVVFGKNGVLVFDDTKPWVEKLAIYKHSIEFSSNEFLLNQSELEYILVKESEPLKNECIHFVEVVNGFKDPMTNGDEGLNVIKVLSGATESLRNNKSVKL